MPVELNTIPQTEIHDAPAPSPRVQSLGRHFRQAVPVPFCGQGLFADALLEASSSRHPSSGRRVLFSFGAHTAILLTLVISPLYFSDDLDLKQFTQTFLVAPLPPPPPPPAPQALVQRTVAPRRTLLSSGKLMAPIAVPSKVTIIKEEPIPPEMGTGISGGVPGGIPGGQLGGVIGGIIDASRAKVPIPALTTQRRAPIRVGGRVRPPRALFRPAPVYPALAKQARIEGVVSVDAVIDTEGNVVEMSVVSGHPLLISAALDTVKKWKYEPTYLNDQAIAVRLIVTVTFQLNQ